MSKAKSKKKNSQKNSDRREGAKVKTECSSASGVLLSIGLIVRNEEKTLERCLKSLEDLRKAIPCELIITDTGSTDKTVELAEKYADQVLHFTWDNDFAAARNQGLKAAKGKWFLYLDGDEWFEDTKEIECFFQSGTYKKYACAFYVQRNYGDLEGKTYGDALVVRIFQRNTHTSFQSSIHEYVPYIKGTEYVLNSYVHHYGYVLSGEQREKKHQRNLEGLYREYEKTPNAIYVLLHLSREYAVHGEIIKAEPYIRAGFSRVKGKPEEDTYPFFYKHMAALYEKKEDWEQVISIIEDYFDCKKEIMPTDLDMHAKLAAAYLALGKKSETKKACIAYLTLYEKNQKGLIKRNRSTTDNVELATEKSFLPLLLATGQLYDQAGENENVLKVLGALAHKSLEPSDTAKTLYLVFKYQVSVSPYIEEIEPAILESLAPGFLQWEGTQALFYRYMGQDIKKLRVESEKARDFLLFLCEIWLKRNSSQVLQGTACLVTPISREEIYTLFKAYKQLLFLRLGELYPGDRTSGEEQDEILPIHQFAYWLRCSEEALEAGDLPAYVKGLGVALKSDGTMKDVVKLLLERLEQEEPPRQERKEKGKSEASQTEFEQYALAVKEKILALFKEGEAGSARELFLVYEKVNPTDAELKELRLSLGIVGGEQSR